MPTADQIRKFCEDLEESLLAALNRRDPVVLKVKRFTREVVDREGDYGGTSMDTILTGVRFVAEIGKPAKKSMEKARRKA